LVSIKKILILEGGYNEEHEVSLNTSLEIQKVFNRIKVKYKVLKVNPIDFEKKILKYKNFICFNALHGTFGEDGQIQKILKKNNINFTHSNIYSSKICFDKILSKKIILRSKILTPKFIKLKIKDLNYKKLLNLKKIFKKFVIKPTKSGSSYGVKIIKNDKDLKYFLSEIENFKKEISYHDIIMIEEFVSGKELTVSTTKFFNKIDTLGVTEIKSKNNFFDYQAKYSKGYSKHIFPANIDKKNYKKCLNLALKSHKILKCGSIARTDFILDTKKNKIYYLETNTQPGLTSISLLPEQAKFKKISFESLILDILRNIN